MNPSPSHAPFTSAHFRATIVKVLLVVGAIVTGLSLLAEALSLAFSPVTADQELADNPGGAIMLLVTFLFSVLDLIIYITTVVFFAMWLYRAYSNLRAFAPWPRLEYSPGWAVGSFFIPFVNLVVPYRAVKETWQKSLPPDESLLSAINPPAWLPVWWTFWLLASFAGNISMRLSFNEKVSETTATKVSIVASALSVVAALLAYLVVDAIDKRQEETKARLQLGTIPGPPPPPPMAPLAAPAYDLNNSRPG